MAVAMLAAGVAQAAGVPGQGTWETTLQPRDIDGDTVTDAFYDTALNITWLRDANVNGLMDWASANTWANTLVVGGVGGWRLPAVGPVNGTSFQYDFTNNGSTDSGYAKTGVGWGSASEMGHLYYVTLGNKGACTPDDASPDSCVAPPGWGLSNSGGFQNLQSGDYWSGTEYASAPNRAWIFGPYDGLQFGFSQFLALYAMAVRPGDVFAVPEPQTWAMLLLGLGAVMVAVRSRAG